MKQFIYLDTDIVNSIIAQKEKGLVLETASEHEDAAGKESTKTGNISLDGSVGGGIWKFAQAQAELTGTGGLEFNSHSQTVLKEIATKPYMMQRLISPMNKSKQRAILPSPMQIWGLSLN